MNLDKCGPPRHQGPGAWPDSQTAARVRISSPVALLEMHQVHLEEQAWGSPAE